MKEERQNERQELLEEAKRVKAKANLYRDAVQSLKAIAFELMKSTDSHREAMSVVDDIRKYTDKEYKLYDKLIDINEKLSNK